MNIFSSRYSLIVSFSKMNERIKTYNSDKYRLYGDLMNHEWDTGHTTGIDATKKFPAEISSYYSS